MDRITWHHAVIGIIAIPVLIGLYHGTVITVNHVTRGDMSQYVSHHPCASSMINESGMQERITCPEGMRCFADFDADRVGTDIAGGRCVAPAYEEEYCGIFEEGVKQVSFPPSMTTCQRLPFSRIIRGIISHPDQFISTLTASTEEDDLIAEHNLTLAKQDPHAEQAMPDKETITYCSYGAINVTEAVYRPSNETVAVTVENTGNINFHEIVISIFYQDTVQEYEHAALDANNSRTVTIDDVAEQPEMIRASARRCPSVAVTEKEIE